MRFRYVTFLLMVVALMNYYCNSAAENTPSPTNATVKSKFIRIDSVHQDDQFSYIAWLDTTMKQVTDTNCLVSKMILTPIYNHIILINGKKYKDVDSLVEYIEFKCGQKEFRMTAYEVFYQKEFKGKNRPLQKIFENAQWMAIDSGSFTETMYRKICLEGN